MEASVTAVPLPAPSLLLFHHLSKSGGSTIREWLLRNAGKLRFPRRLDGVLRLLFLEGHRVLRPQVQN